MEEINVQRGLKKGDPLAPFLFLLVAEGFSGLMSNAVNRHLFHGFEIKRGVRVFLVTTRFFVDFIFMCLYMLVCDLGLWVYFYICLWVFVVEGYFGLLVSKSNLVIP